MRTVILGDFAETTSGSTPARGKKEYWYPAEIPWVKTAEVAFRPITATEECISKIALEECSLTLLPPETILVAMYGQGKTRGQSAILKVPATINQACFAVLPNETWEPEYLFLWLNANYQNLRELSEDRGGNQANLNGSLLKSLRVPAPEKPVQRQIAARLKAQLAEVDKARLAAEAQLDEITNLANAIIRQSVEHPDTTTAHLGDTLDEVKQGIGPAWADYPVLGATRAGLALAKEPVGKQPGRYKPVQCGTVFYNPMRIMIGSIAMVDEDDTPGITSPDYVVLRGKPGMVDSRWFYYWLRSPFGESCIASLARGAVRERMLFNRLAEGEIELPPYDVQITASKALAELRPMRRAVEGQLREINLLPEKILAKAFNFNE